MGRRSQLKEALAAGDPQAVRSLISAGADIHYTDADGYDALINAVHVRDITRDPRLLELLALLVNHGVNLSGVSAYGESGLRVLSRLGRFDAVRLLLEAGADRDQLEWTPLMQAVALGSLDDVRAELDRGPDLEARDFWSRTAWLIALVAGDIAKAELLFERGVDPDVRGRCGQPGLFHAIQSRQPDMVRWLLDQGADVHQTDDFGSGVVQAAVEADDPACLEVLLEAGAPVDVDAHGTPLARARSRMMITSLLEAGADWANLSHEGKRLFLGLPEVGKAPLKSISVEDFRHGRRRWFGRSNPERMRVPFWEAMIRSGVSAYTAREHFGETELFSPAVWCAERFGQSLTMLPDGRSVQIGGEHEDFYDPDFCIYNDVFVHEPDGSVTIYGYPEKDFGPTDFHTATLAGDAIYVIGCLGYAGARRPGETPVYRLDLRTWRIDRLDTTGDAPGWIHRHRVDLADDGRSIRIRGGEVVTSGDASEPDEPNRSVFVLNLDTLRWRVERSSRAT